MHIMRYLVYKMITAVFYEENIIVYRYNNVLYCHDLSIEPFTFPASVTTTSNCFFYACTLIEPPVIPNTVTKIGEHFLSECENLTKPPIIPNSVTEIGMGFLSDCKSLTEAPRIPLSVTLIGNDFLSYCPRIKEPPIIPKSVVDEVVLIQCRGVSQTLRKWFIKSEKRFVIPYACREYWRRKNAVRVAVLTQILVNIPFHIL